jgi:hypothetical protein
VTGWGLTWALWLAVIAASFAYLEARALHDPKTGDTLTDNVRAWFRTEQRGWAGRLGRVLFLVLMAAFPVWFAVHILVPGFV